MKKLTDAKEELERLYGVKVVCVQADVNDSADNEAVVNNVVKQAIDTFWRIDVLIINAQASASAFPLADHTTEQFISHCIPVCTPHSIIMKACYPYLRKRRCCHQLASARVCFGNYGSARIRSKRRHSRPDPRCRHRMGQGRINVNVVCPRWHGRRS